MTTTKTTFQEDMSELEGLLSGYKDSYPTNLGSMVRVNLPVFMIVLGVMMFVGAFVDSDNDFGRGACVVSPAMVIVGVFLRWRKMFTFEDIDMDPSEMEQKIATAEGNYAQYPDVCNYLKQFNGAFSAEKQRKNKIRWIFRILFFGFFVLYAVKLVVDFSSKPLYSTYEGMHNEGRYSDVLAAKHDFPFLNITPYKSAISDSVKVNTDTLHVFIGYKIDDAKYYLTTKCPDISGYGSDDIFRLKITDENGRPIPRCPTFVFKIKEKQWETERTPEIKSADFQYTSNLDDNALQTLETLRYLQANKEHLRFIVEKI